MTVEHVAISVAGWALTYALVDGVPKAWRFLR